MARPRPTKRNIEGCPGGAGALVDFAPPYTVPELVQRSGASTGATYRVLEFLEQEDLLQRKPRGPVTAVAWRQIIERWSQDYGFQRSDVVQSFLFPRGIEAVPEALRTLDEGSYVLTGSLAAQAYEPYAPPRLAMLYVTDVAEVADRLDLKPLGGRHCRDLDLASGGDLTEPRAQNENRSAAAHLFAAAGHEVETVSEEGLTGTPDEPILDICRREGRLLVTFPVTFGLERFQRGNRDQVAVALLAEGQLAGLQQPGQVRPGHPQEIGRLRGRQHRIAAGRERVHDLVQRLERVRGQIDRLGVPHHHGHATRTRPPDGGFERAVECREALRTVPRHGQLLTI